MSPLLIAFLVCGVVAVLFLLYLVSLYKQLVALKNRFQNAFAQIDVQLKRRYDLIPNLVETAKGYMTHEKETLDAVIRARNAAASAGVKAAANPGDAQAINNLSTGRSCFSWFHESVYRVSGSFIPTSSQPKYVVFTRRVNEYRKQSFLCSSGL